MRWRRLFTFGCSYTEYYWETWADIIGRDLGIPYYNYGLSGCGNSLIAHRMLEADIEHGLSSDDLILVNWTSWWREDRVNPREYWLVRGHIFNNPHYSGEFIKRYWNTYNDTAKNAGAIISSNRAFPIVFQSHMTDYEIDDYADALKSFSTLVSALPEKHLFDVSNNSKFGGTSADAHPDILCHLNHAIKIYDYCGLTMSEETVEWCNARQEELINRNKKKT